MSVRELTRDQLTELKGNYLCEQNDLKGEGTSWGELASADRLVSDEVIFEEYSEVEFVGEDFSY